MRCACCLFAGDSSPRSSKSRQSSSRVASSLLRLIQLSAATLMGCSTLIACGEAELGTRKWTCQQKVVEKSFTTSAAASHFWRFDDQSAPGRDSHATDAGVVDAGVVDAGVVDADVVGASLAVDGGTVDGGVVDVPAVGTLVVRANVSESIRLGDVGAALSSDSGTTVFAEGHVPLVTSPVTYSVWITAPKQWLGAPERNRVILSVGHQPCAIHELALRRTEAGSISVVFSYFDPNCQLREVTRTIPRMASQDAWGLGKWYHLAAVIGPGSAGCAPGESSEVSLYWDAKQLTEPTEAAPRSECMASGGPDQQLSKVCVGAGLERLPGGIGDTCSTLPAFQGAIDDVALFGRALDARELRDFRMDSLSRFQMGAYRWAASSTWPSTASLSLSTATGGGLTVDVQDLSWSAGSAIALVSDPGDGSLFGGLQLNNIGHIDLSGDLPEGKSVSFQLNANNGREFCAWYFAGKGGADYRLSRDVPGVHDVGEVAPDARFLDYALKWCRCDTCDCRSNVEGASIASAWEDRLEKYQCLLCDLELHAATGTEGGSTGWKAGQLWTPGSGEELANPEGWCWRPIAYNAESYAYLVSGKTVGAKLFGPENTGALLVADFGVPPPSGEQSLLDLSACQGQAITFDFNADFNGEDAASPGNSPQREVQLILVSANSASLEMPVTGQGHETISWILPATFPEQPDANAPREDGEPVIFDPAHVRYLGVQKSWRLTGEVDVTINDIVLPPCARRTIPEQPLL
jgi:hypothetical protein